MATISNFPAETVPQAPEDPLFGLLNAYKADTSPSKVDLVSDGPGCEIGTPSHRQQQLTIFIWTEANPALCRESVLTVMITPSLGFCPS